MAKPEKNVDEQSNPNTEKKSLWNSHAFLMVVAFVSAVFAWSLVTMVFDPQSTLTRTNVEVNYAYDVSKYTSQGLNVVERGDVSAVSVEFKGNGTLIGDIQTSDFIVYPNYSGVKGAGEAVLSLRVVITNTEYSSVTATVLNPRTVTMVFDTVGEKTLPVTVEASGISVAEGCTLSKTSAVPAEVTIQGPTSELDNITNVVAPVTTEDTLSDSVTINTMLELRDDNGAAIEPEYITMENDAADVTLTVYQVRELPLVVNFINTPTGFDDSSLKYSLSQQTMKVQGPSRTVSSLSELSVASFDLGQSFAFDRDYQLQVELPAGLESIDGITTVTLGFDTNGMATKSLTVSNIRCINVPSNCDIEVLTDQINSVELYGPAEDMEALSAGSVVAQIDCQNISVATGRQTLPVSINIPSSSRIFATGSYTVQCQVRGK